MSPASKSKSKDKSTPKAAKEQSKVSILKPPPSLHSNSGNGPTANAYNPALGTFRTLEVSPPQSSGRFRSSTDDPDDQSGSSPGTTLEYDSLSNNDSSSGDSEDMKDKLSGESEDPREEKSSIAPSSRAEIVPGCDNDKRDKIRQKNERKHQRQRERRAQELHERCTALLVSRKLESLSGQLVSMGFPSDRAITAVVLNEGRLEESVSWLLHEGGEEDNKQQRVSAENKSAALKIDISDELARIAELEVKYRCLKQDVERAVVGCDGDLSKVENILILQKQSPPPVADQSPVLVRTPAKAQQPRQDRKDPNHFKSMAPRNLLHESSANKNLLPLPPKSIMQAKPTDRPRPPPASSVDKRWLTVSSAPSASLPFPSTVTTSAVQVSLQPLCSTVQSSGAQAKLNNPWCGMPAGNEAKTSFQVEAAKDPFVAQQPKQNLSSSSFGPSVLLPSPTGWYPGVASSIDMLTTANTGLVHNLSSGLVANGSTLQQQLYHQNGTHALASDPSEFSKCASWNGYGQAWNASGNHLPLATPSSLGLFAGRSSSGLSAQNDWNASGYTPHPDYTAIDWSLDLTPLQPSFSVRTVSDPWPSKFVSGSATPPPKNRHHGAHLYGLERDGRRAAIVPSASASAAAPSEWSDPTSRSWSNPFEGMDLFRVPREHVTSPTL